MVGAMEDTVLSVIAFDMCNNEIAILLRNMQNEWGFYVSVNERGLMMQSAVDVAVQAESDVVQKSRFSGKRSVLKLSLTVHCIISRRY